MPKTRVFLPGRTRRNALHRGLDPSVKSACGAAPAIRTRSGVCSNPEVSQRRDDYRAKALVVQEHRSASFRVRTEATQSRRLTTTVFGCVASCGPLAPVAAPDLAAGPGDEVESTCSRLSIGGAARSAAATAVGGCSAAVRGERWERREHPILRRVWVLGAGRCPHKACDAVCGRLCSGAPGAQPAGPPCLCARESRRGWWWCCCCR